MIHHPLPGPEHELDRHAEPEQAIPTIEAMADAERSWIDQLAREFGIDRWSVLAIADRLRTGEPHSAIADDYGIRPSDVLAVVQADERRRKKA